MFRFKCHEIGQAITIHETFIRFCNCITAREIEEMVRAVKAEAKQSEAKDGSL